MMKEFGQMMGMLKNLPKLKEETERLQAKIREIQAEGSAGAGMVTVKVNGEMQVIRCTISDDAWKMQDKEMLEDLMAAAVNQAVQKVRDLVAQETGKMAMGMGMGLPVE